MKKLLHLLTGLAIYIIAIGSVFAADEGVAPIKPDQTDIRFIPYPKDNLPENIAKGTSESVFLRPVHTGDTVYYRILSVEGADQTSPIGKTDVKVERHEFGGVKDYVPIKLTEDLVNADGQFVVKAATLRADGVTWSENVTAAYNVVFGEHVSATKLAFEAGEPTELMVGESYEMQLSLTAPEDSLARYGNAGVNLIINMEGGIDFADVQYKFAEADEWTSVDPDDLDDLIRIPNTFKNFAEKGVWVKLVMSRKKRSDEMWMMLGIVQGNSFLDGKAISSVIDMTVPCVDRPAADPVFSPAAGYVAKGSTVTISSATNGALVRYTTDGTEPTATTGTLYENPVAINGLTTIKAIAVTADGSGTSFVSEAVYSVVGIPQITPYPEQYAWIVYDSMVEITLGEGAPAEGVEIYYTTDGTEPTATNGTHYTNRFPLRTNVLRAVAIKGEDRSPVVTVEYRLRPAPPTATPTPVRENNKPVPVPYGTKVKLECATDEAEIYWRIGGYTAVTANDNRYTEEIELKDASTMLKAVAIYNGVESEQVSFTYTVTLAAPEFSIPEGEVPEGARVVISSKSVAANTNPNKQVNIAYTLDGTEPTKANVQSLPKYKDAIEITETVTIKAMTWTVWTQGLEVSEMSTVTYTVGAGDDPETPVLPETVKAPTFDPVAGEVEKGTEISWKWDESYNEYDMVGVVYVANGKEADLNIDGEKLMELYAESSDYTDARADGKVYLYLAAEEDAEAMGMYKVEKDVTLQACLFVAMQGEEDEVQVKLSPVVTAAYTVKTDPVTPPDDPEVKVAKPTFDPVAGAVKRGTKVTVSCETEGAVIYYTLDGTEPTDKSAKYEAAIEIKEAVTVKAIAIKGDAKSEVAEAAYTIDLTANEDLELAGVTVYPNPSNGLFNLELPVAATVEVFMSNGVLYQRLNAAAGVATLNIERNGIYFLRITGEGRTTVKRIIVR